MLALRLPNDIEQRLADLATKTGCSKSFYAREAILEYLEKLEDAYLAAERLKAPFQTVSPPKKILAVLASPYSMSCKGYGAIVLIIIGLFSTSKLDNHQLKPVG